jgi:hypothetical protein
MSYDPEKGATEPYVSDAGAVPGENFEYGSSLYARLQRWAGKLGVEQRGIERVPSDERTDTSLLNVGTMWLSANMVVSSLAIGILGKQLFFLGFADSVLVILFFNLLGIMPVCYYSTFGPVFGLRQMVLSRFWYGWWGVKLSMLPSIAPAKSPEANHLPQLPSSTSSPASVGPVSTPSSVPSSSTP